MNESECAHYKYAHRPMMNVKIIHKRVCRDAVDFVGFYVLADSAIFFRNYKQKKQKKTPHY